MLLPKHSAYLAARAVPTSVAVQAGLRSVDAEEASTLLGRTVDSGGLAIPYPGEVPAYHRIRFDNDDPRFGVPGGLPVPVYVPLIPAPSNGPLVVVEGPIKALALVALGMPVVALGGTGTTLEPAGQGRGLNQSWNPLDVRGRTATVLFDSNRRTNPAVARDEGRLVSALMRAGANVLVANLPPPPSGDWGPDDYLQANGSVALQAVLDQAVPGDPATRASEAGKLQPAEAASQALVALLGDLPFLLAVGELDHSRKFAVDQAFRQHRLLSQFGAAVKSARANLAQFSKEDRSLDDEYCVKGGELCVIQAGKDGPCAKSICNFTACITKERHIDDGLTKRKVFVVNGTLHDGTPLEEITLDPDQLGAGRWPLEKWGAAANLAAWRGADDHLRAAIQRLSSREIEHFYGRTGWLREGDTNVFLHAGGAVGGRASVSLDGRLQLYALPDETGDVRAAWAAALSILDIAPRRITVPLLLAALRAPLAAVCPVDCVLHVFGTTGVFKSTIVAVFLNFFGRFTHDSLPASFSDTFAALETKLAILRDVLTAIDEFTPGSSPNDPARHLAERVVRLVANRAPRSRMRRDLSAQQDRMPNGLLITTGEDLSMIASIVARTLAIPLRRGDVDKDKLSRMQGEAAILGKAMRGYLEWLGPRLGLIDLWATERLSVLRISFQNGSDHARSASAAAHLMLAGEVLHEFLVEVGVYTASAADEALESWRTALMEALVVQRPAGEYADPGTRFFEVLSSLLRSQRAELREPHAASTPSSVGWRNGNEVWLDPSLAYSAVQQFLRLEGSSLGPSAHALWQQLKDTGRLLASDTDRPPVKRSVGAKKVRVVVVAAAALGLVPHVPSNPLRSPGGSNKDKDTKT